MHVFTGDICTTGRIHHARARRFNQLAHAGRNFAKGSGRRTHRRNRFARRCLKVIGNRIHGLLAFFLGAFFGGYGFVFQLLGTQRLIAEIFQRSGHFAHFIGLAGMGDIDVQIAFGHFPHDRRKIKDRFGQEPAQQKGGRNRKAKNHQANKNSLPRRGICAGQNRLAWNRPKDRPCLRCIAKFNRKRNQIAFNIADIRHNELALQCLRDKLLTDTGFLNRLRKQVLVRMCCNRIAFGHKPYFPGA